jgi:hypothetical protein
MYYILISPNENFYNQIFSKIFSQNFWDACSPVVLMYEQILI